MSVFLRICAYAVGAGGLIGLPSSTPIERFQAFPICIGPSGKTPGRSDGFRAILDPKASFIGSRARLVASGFVQSAAAAETSNAALEAAPPAILEPLKLAPAPRREHGLTNFSLAVGGPVVPAEAHEVAYDLNITYADGEIWNPATQKSDKVRLRSYQGAQSALPRFIAPAIEVLPGQTVRITLHNNLPDDPTCRIKGGSADTPHCFNGTNLHTHGLWVNPAGNGDNVLLSLNPGISFQYEYNIPPDHPAGTYWYHSHRHGSTALQVSSGMAGALIVRGTRLPTLDANGDLDTLLKPTKSQPFLERTMVFQQIQYACRDSNGNIETNPDKTYKCAPGQVGGVEDYDQFGPGTWPTSGRFTSINGAVLGHLDDAVAGRVERWRMIHGGVRDTIAFQLRKLSPTAKAPTNLTAVNAPSYVKANCTGDALPFHLVAADGLTMAAAQRVSEAIFQPGYRWDALIVFPEAGDYCVINDLAGSSASVNQNERRVQILGFVHVGAGEALSGDPSNFLAKQLETAAEANMPAQVRDKVLGELRDGIKLSSFTPHPDVKDDELTGKQTLVFKIDVSQLNEVFFEIDGQPYDPNRIDRTLMLGGADEWTLRSEFVSHPYHIHVNPFQVVKIIAPDGKTDVSAKGAIDNFAKDKNGNSVVDPQYPGLQNVWKDTLFIKNVAQAGGPSGEYTVVVRTRYERYIGDFVLHCHILDHEDQGMMQNVRIALPDGKGGVVMEHH